MFVRTLRGLAATAALLAAVSTTASAQAAASGRFSVAGGVALPMGDLGDVADMGFGIGGSYAMMISKLNVRFDVDWTRHGLSDIDGSISQLGGTVNAIFPFADKGVYGLAGLGFYNQTIDIDGFGSDSEGDLAWNVGLGFGKDRWAIEAKYRSIMTEDEATNSLPVVFRWKF